MSVVWEDESVGGFCDFPWWDLCTVSLLGFSGPCGATARVWPHDPRHLSPKPVISGYRQA